MLRDFLQDLRYGARTLRRSRGFTVMVVLTLALGIGANATIFSLVNAVLLRSLPVTDPERLLVLSDGLFSGVTGGIPDGGRVNAYSQPLYQHLRDHDQVFEGLAAQEANRTRSVVRWDGPVADADEAANGRLVTANYFAVIGVGAQRGRLFLPEDETAPGANPVAVLSHGYWQRRFGGNPAVVGAHISINGAPYTVVGVTAPLFTGTRVGEETDLWIPITMQAAFQREGSFRDKAEVSWLVVFGRLKPGASASTAQASLNVALQQYLAPLRRPSSNPRQAYIAVQPGATGVSKFREAFSEPLLALMAGVGLLLLIVCLNVSHLLLARAINRQREMSIRTALGANRARLVRQLLTEGLLLSAAGGAAATVVTRWLGDGLQSVAPAAATLAAAGADLRVSWFTAGLAMATALVLGLVPAWQAGRTNVQQALRGGSSAVTGGGPRRLVSRALLASQVAFSMVLLVGAGLLAGSLSRLRNLDKGFQEENLLLVDLIPRFTGLDQEQVLPLYDDLIRRVEAVPGVRSASMSLGTGRVLGAMSRGGDVVEPGTRQRSPALLGIVTPGFFETMGMTLLRGRPLTREDHRHAPPVAVISESLARRLFGSEDGLGKRVQLGRDAPMMQVVGIVRDARTNEMKNESAEALFQPVAQAPDYLRGLQVRSSGDPTVIANQIRQAVRDAHPDLPVLAVRTMSSRMDLLLENERLLATLSTAFGLSALFLVCIGLYGVISEWAAQRTREIGVRIALGATSGGVRWLVLRQALVLVLVGLAIGLPATMAASRLIRGMLFGVTPMDPATLTLAALLMFLVATLAAYLPARRASRVDPMVALRQE
jgi:predicted permease